MTRVLISRFYLASEYQCVACPDLQTTCSTSDFASKVTCQVHGNGQTDGCISMFYTEFNRSLAYGGCYQNNLRWCLQHQQIPVTTGREADSTGQQTNSTGEQANSTGVFPIGRPKEKTKCYDWHVTAKQELDVKIKCFGLFNSVNSTAGKQYTMCICKGELCNKPTASGLSSAQEDASGAPSPSPPSAGIAAFTGLAILWTAYYNHNQL